MEQELDHALRPLLERLRGLEVEEAEQVDEREREEEERGRPRRSGVSRPSSALDPAEQEREPGRGPSARPRARASRRPPTGASRTRPSPRVARKSADEDRVARSRDRPQQLGGLLDTRPPREPLARLGGKLDVRQAAVPEALDEARRAPRRGASGSSGGATTPAPVSRISSAAAPSGGTAARIGTPGGEVLEHLPGEDTLAAPARLGDQQQQAPPSRAAARARSSAGAYGISSSRSPRPSPSAHSRSAERKSPRKRATTSSPSRARACRNGRGSRLPKKLPACVIRKRSAGR